MQLSRTCSTSDICREIYTHLGGSWQPVIEPSQPKGWYKFLAQKNAKSEDGPVPQLQLNEPLATPKSEICGISFGSVGHLAVLYSNGTVAVLALRPHAARLEEPDEPLRPSPLALVAREEFISTGACCHVDQASIVLQQH
jgi:hypothetical protein